MTDKRPGLLSVLEGMKFIKAKRTERGNRRRDGHYAIAECSVKFPERVLECDGKPAIAGEIFWDLICGDALRNKTQVNSGIVI